MYLQAYNDNYKCQQLIITLHYSVLRLTDFLSTTQLFLFLFTLLMDLSFSILVDINLLVRIVQHTGARGDSVLFIYQFFTETTTFYLQFICLF